MLNTYLSHLSSSFQSLHLHFRSRLSKSRRLRKSGQRLALICEWLEDRCVPAMIGYYDMSLQQGNSTQAAPIEAAGHTAVFLSDLTAADLTGIDVLMVQNPSTIAYGEEFLLRLPDVHNAVANGMTVVIHDSLPARAANILPGGGSFQMVRNFNANIDVLDATTVLTNGPGGVITNTNLDNLIWSNHGYAMAASLPADAQLLLSNGSSSHIVAFSYGYGNGMVYYASIPLDHFLAASNSNNMKTIYAPNVVAYAVDLLNVPPVAAAGADQSVNAGETVFFDGSGSFDTDGHLVSYHWDFGDGNSAEGVAVNHVYANAGTYTVTLTVTDNRGGVSTDTLLVSVSDNIAIPEVDASGPASGVRGQPLAFSGSVTGSDIWSATVDFGDGSGATALALNTDNTFSFNHVYNAAGAYTIIVQVEGSGGIASWTHDVAVNVIELQADPHDPTQTWLVVGGTMSHDIFLVHQTKASGEIMVWFNGGYLGSFAPTAGIIVYGQEGRDYVFASTYVSLPIELQGENISMCSGGIANILVSLALISQKLTALDTMLADWSSTSHLPEPLAPVTGKGIINQGLSAPLGQMVSSSAKANGGLGKGR